VQKRSSIAAEIGWLLLFLAIFAIVAFLFIRLVVPHHFNDRIAITLAALFSGLIMIVIRAWWQRR
jgi:hypothetical protein